MELKTLKDEQKRDSAIYFVEDGEAGFSPEYNKMVIERTIKKAELNRKKKHEAYIETIRERSDAVVTYLKSRAAEGNTPVEKYFGKRNMAYLRGERILEKLKSNSLLGRKNRDIYITGD